MSCPNRKESKLLKEVTGVVKFGDKFAKIGGKSALGSFIHIKMIVSGAISIDGFAELVAT